MPRTFARPSRARSAPFLLLFLAACGDAGGGSTTPAASGGSGAAPPPPAGNPLQGAVVLVLDTLRADRLSCYGHARPTSPQIDALARHGVLFEQVISSAPWTKPGLYALLAGVHPARAMDPRDMKLTRSLVQEFRRAGYATAAFTEGGFFSKFYRMDQGFDEFVEEQGPVHLSGPEVESDPHAPPGGIERTFANAQAWLAQNLGRRFLCVVHTYEPHTPYADPSLALGLDPGEIGPSFDHFDLERFQSGAAEITDAEIEYVRALYDADVRRTDEVVGRFLSWLDENGLGRNTLVVVTSDHGEELGEHHRPYTGDHGHALHDTQLRVPLIVRDPTRAFPEQRIRSQVRVLDVLPTVAELLGVPLPGGLDGRSLLPVLEGREKSDRPAISAWTKRGPGRGSLRQDGWHLIEVVRAARPGFELRGDVPHVQLFNVRDDPGETVNLVAEKPELVQAMRRYLEQANERMMLADEVQVGAEGADAALLERLRSLGYVR